MQLCMLTAHPTQGSMRKPCEMMSRVSNSERGYGILVRRYFPMCMMHFTAPQSINPVQSLLHSCVRHAFPHTLHAAWSCMAITSTCVALPCTGHTPYGLIQYTGAGYAQMWEQSTTLMPPCSSACLQLTPHKVMCCAHLAK